MIHARDDFSLIVQPFCINNIIVNRPTRITAHAPPPWGAVKTDQIDYKLISY